MAIVYNNFTVWHKTIAVSYFNLPKKETPPNKILKAFLNFINDNVSLLLLSSLLMLSSL